MVLHDGADRKLPLLGLASSATPSVVDSGDATAVELGVRFRSDVNGYITGLRFYKAAANTGTHVGIMDQQRNPSCHRNLYRLDGLRLATGDLPIGGCRNGWNHLRGLIFRP